MVYDMEKRKYSENSSRIRGQFSKESFSRNMSKIIFSMFSADSQIFPSIVRELTENFLNINLSQVLPKAFFRVSSVSEFFLEVRDDFFQRFQAKFIGQDGAILPDDQPIRLGESIAG